MTVPWDPEMKSQEEVAAEDPFQGNGCFIEDKESSADEMFDKFFGVLGEMGAVAWEGQGIWLDASAVEGGAQSLKERWAESQKPLSKVRSSRAKK